MSNSAFENGEKEYYSGRTVRFQDGRNIDYFFYEVLFSFKRVRRWIDVNIFSF